MTRPEPTAPPLVLVALSRSTLAELLAPERAGALPGIGRQLDAAADALILGSDLVLPTDAPARTTETGAASAGVDPTIAAITLTHHTRRTGLVVAAAPQRDHPYNLARRLASIDHASAGRAGLFIGSADRQAAPGSPWTSADPVAAAADAVTALRALWRSFPVDAIIADRDTGVFAESHRILAIDHRGAFDIDGPLQVPWSPQIWPPVLAWSGSAGFDTAGSDDTGFDDTGSGTSGSSALARIADVVVGPHSAAVDLHAVGDLAALHEFLAAAPGIALRPESAFPLRARFGLAPTDPPAEGRAVFPGAGNASTEGPAEGKKVASRVR